MTFEGFTPPVDDYFRMPNAWINICAKIDSLAELKIVQYVLRHTWGYQGFSGARKITIDEFMHGRKRKDGSRIDDGTGLSKQSVISGTEAAIKHGYLTCDTDKKDLARQKKYYQLAMRTDVKPLDSIFDVKMLDIQSGVKNLDISDVKNLDLDVKGLDSDGQEFRQRSEKDSIERHFKKDNQTQESTDASAIASAAHPPFSQQEEQAEQIRIATDTPKAIVPEIEDVPPDENNSHGEVTQANSVAPVVSARADELPPVVRPPRPQPTPPVLKAIVPEKQSNLLDCPLSEPRMTGPWDDEKCVQYAEWYKKRRYTDKMRPGQLQAAHLLSKEDSQLTLEQFKLAFDDWRPWWTENRGPLNVSDLRVKQKNGVQRYQTALDRLEMQGNKSRQQPARPQPHMPKRMPTREEMKKEPV